MPTERDAGWLVVDPMNAVPQGMPRNGPTPELQIVPTNTTSQSDTEDSKILADTLAALSHYSLNRSQRTAVDRDFCCM